MKNENNLDQLSQRIVRNLYKCHKILPPPLQKKRVFMYKTAYCVNAIFEETVEALRNVDNVGLVRKASTIGDFL